MSFWSAKPACSCLCLSPHGQGIAWQGWRPPELMGHLNSHCAFVPGSARAGCCLLVLPLVLGQITRNFLENTTRVQHQPCALPG